MKRKTIFLAGCLVGALLVARGCDGLCSSGTAPTAQFRHHILLLTRSLKVSCNSILAIVQVGISLVRSFLQ